MSKIMAPIASNLAAVISNIERFEQELERSADLQDRLAYARAWYAHHGNNGVWRFGPSKFVGYEGLDAEGYIMTAEVRDGRRTEAQLRKWFTIVEPSSPLHDELNAALSVLLARYGKAPSTKSRISVVRHGQLANDGEDITDPNKTIVDLIVAVAKNLPSEQIEVLKARLSS